jgi:DNA-binding response OmpR family regulator
MTGNPSPVNILMVDDEPANLLALGAVLESLGQNLVRANSGEEALRHLIYKDFAVILLDVMMPGMNGFETAALIRNRDRSRHTPIIFMTAMGKTEPEMFKGYSLGAIDYMIKPYRPAVLRAKVTVLMDLHRKKEEVTRMNDALTRKANELVVLNMKLALENEKHKRTLEELRLGEESLKTLNADLRLKTFEHKAAVLDQEAPLEPESLR